jgi:hypothetical protein
MKKRLSRKLKTSLGKKKAEFIFKKFRKTDGPGPGEKQDPGFGRY